MPKGARQKDSKKVLHPSSRKAGQLSRLDAHRERVLKNRAKATKDKRQVRSLLNWLHEQVAETAEEAYSRDDVCDMIEEYISRFDEELEEIRLAATLKGRQVRPHAAREDAIRMVREKEMRLLTGPGYEAPDLTEAKNLTAFRKWDKKQEHVHTFRMTKFRRAAEA